MPSRTVDEEMNFIKPRVQRVVNEMLNSKIHGVELSQDHILPALAMYFGTNADGKPTRADTITKRRAALYDIVSNDHLCYEDLPAALQKRLQEAIENRVSETLLNRCVPGSEIRVDSTRGNKAHKRAM